MKLAMNLNTLIRTKLLVLCVTASLLFGYAQPDLDSVKPYAPAPYQPTDSFGIGSQLNAFEYQTFSKSAAVVEAPDPQTSLEDVKVSWSDLNPTSIFDIKYKRNHVYWLRVQFIKPDYPEKKERIWINTQGWDSVTVFVPDADLGYKPQSFRKHWDVNSRKIPLWLPVFEVDLTLQDTTTVFARLVPENAPFFIGTIRPPSLYQLNQRSFERSLPFRSYATGFFQGLYLILFLSFFLVMLITRERSFAYLTMAVGGMTIYDIHESLRKEEFNALYGLYDTTLQEALLFIGAFIFLSGLLKFCSYFLELKSIFRRINYFINGTLIIFMIITLLAFLDENTPYHLPIIPLMQYFRLTTLAIFTLILGLGITAVFYRKQLAWYFLLGMLPIILAGLTGIYLSIFGLRFSIPYYDIYRIGNLGSVIVFAIVMAFRMNSFRKKEAEAQRLQELDNVKNKFFTNFTHELRTPLTNILGMTEQIEAAPTQWLRNGLPIIKRNGQNLLYIVNQILDLTKVEVGKLKLYPIQDDIIYYLKYLLESFHSSAEQKDIVLTFTTDSAEIVMDYDPERIRQIVSNLLSNAIKFTPVGGEVKFQATTDHHKLELNVSDTGIGLRKEDQARIFDRFYQADERPSEGTGIGLALTKELVELMNGEIFVTCEVGKGTTFTIELPITQEAEGRKAIESTNAIDAEDPTVAGSHELSSDSEKPILLIVEDNADVVFLLQSYLQHDYQLLHASNGRKGIAKAQETVPDIILSDVMMPEIDGFELTRQLKNHEVTSHIPILLLTARADMDSKIEGLTDGADDYISKPFHKEELMVRLHNLIESRKKLQAYYQSTPAGEPAPDSGKQEDLFVRRIRKILETNISDEHFGVTELSAQVNLGRQQVHRKLKSLTGRSTSEFMHAVRVEYSKKLLRNTDLSIKEIAYRVGYRDHSDYTKKFRAEFGRTPSDWRKLL